MHLRIRRLLDCCDDLENIHILRQGSGGFLAEQYPGPLSLGSTSPSWDISILTCVLTGDGSLM